MQWLHSEVESTVSTQVEDNNTVITPFFQQNHRSSRGTEKRCWREKD